MDLEFFSIILQYSTMGCSQSKNQTADDLAEDFFGTSEESPRPKQPKPAAHPNRNKDPSKNANGAQKTQFVAPPSSVSFGLIQSQQPSTNTTTMKPPPPPPPLATTSTMPSLHTIGGDSVSQAQQRSTPRKLDDDDFSVAPSLNVEMRSVVNHSFNDIYERGKKLGYGAFAEVFLGVHRPTGATYAIKQVDRSKMFWGDRDALKDEIKSLQMVRDGPNIVQLYEIYEEQTFCYLVTELMLGGELFDRIIEKKTFTEKEARSCCRCMLSALEYMHERRVAHRDLKPENLLLADPKLLLPVKLADFGFAKSIEKKNGCRTLCGTPGYLAPEILEKFPAYDVKCDVWSVGVILFLLLGGYLPFDDDDEDKVFDKTRNGQYDFRPRYWKNISSGAKDLVTKCLTLKPSKRATATEALNHDWMVRTTESELASHQVDVDKLKHIVEAKRKMKVAVNTLVAANRLQQLNDDFSHYMDKRRGESMVSHFSYMTCGTKSGHVRYVEDSPSGKPFNTFFTMGELLGEGNHSYIYQAVRNSTQEQYAVKHIDLSRLQPSDRETIEEEIASLRLLRGGPNIVRMFDVFEELEDIYLVFEQMKGGNLLSRISEKEVYTEREARQVCKIAFTAVDYCHKKKVAHRDIKPENFLLVEDGDDTSVKLADFAFSKKVSYENSLKTICGTAQYVAPEILDPGIKGYDQRCDLWSLGVFAYMLLGGYPPFEGIIEDLAQEILCGYFEFHDEYWSEISEPAKDMIGALLVSDPAKRITASQAMSCKWMEIEDEQLILRDLSMAQASIRKNQQPKEKFKLAVNAIIARNKFLSIVGMVADSTTNFYDESMGLVEEYEETFEENYIWGEQIGSGTFSVVHEVLHVQTEYYYAAKRVSRKDLHPSDAAALHDEIAALQEVTDCDHIVKLYDVYDEPDFTYLVLECMRGGDLIDRIIEKRHYTEFDAKEVSRKLILGVAYCHEKKIANRNLKPENLLLKAGSDTEVKISDFGYAKKVTFPNSLRTQCGTEGYVAPEILTHRPSYDVPCDMWSLGVIIYIVLGGYRPFRGEGEEVMKQIRYGEFKFHKRYWSHVSDDAKNLITRMLTVDPERRITAKSALNSRWIRASEDALGTELSNNMKDLKVLKSAKSKVKNAVNTIIATNKLQSIGGMRAYQDF